MATLRIVDRWHVLCGCPLGFVMEMPIGAPARGASTSGRGRHDGFLGVKSHFDKTAGLCVLNGRGHDVVISTTMPRRTWRRSCWCRRFWSVEIRIL
jgi:hypothetical protein